MTLSILFLILGIVFLFISLIGFLAPNPSGGNYRRFKKWHLFKLLTSYIGNPERLSNAVDNMDRIKELETKSQHKSLPRMSYELKEAERDYAEAIKHCNGSKAAERAVREAYIQQRARIKEKYNHE